MEQKKVDDRDLEQVAAGGTGMRIAKDRPAVPLRPKEPLGADDGGGGGGNTGIDLDNEGSGGNSSLGGE